MTNIKSVFQLFKTLFYGKFIFSITFNAVNRSFPKALTPYPMLFVFAEDGRIITEIVCDPSKTYTLIEE